MPSREPPLAVRPADQLFALSPDLLCAVGTDGRFVLVNPAFERMLGWSADRLLAQPWADFVCADDRARAGEAWRRAAAGDEVGAFDSRVLCADGSPRWISWRLTPPDADGLAYAIGRDVTDYKRAESALREREALLRGAFDHAPDGAALTAPDGRWIRVNRSFCEIVGYSEAELLATTFQAITHPDDRAQTLALSRELLAGERGPYQYQKRYVHRQGHAVWVSLTVALVPDADDRSKYFLAQIQDITERVHAEAALRESEARYRALVETAHEGVWVVDTVGVTTHVNARVCAILGYPAESLLGRAIFDFMGAEAAFEARTLFARRRRGIADLHELTFARHDGSELFALVASSPLTDREGEFSGVLAMITDVTERRGAEAALRESEARFGHIAASVPGLVYQYEYRPNGTQRFTYVNERVRELFGVAPEAIVRDPAALFDLVHPEDRPSLHASGQAAVAALVPWQWEGRVVLHTGEERWIAVTSHNEQRPDGTILANGILLDITERHRAAERLAASEARFRLATRATSDVVYDWDIVADTHFWGETLHSAFGYEPDRIELDNRWWADRIHPDDAPKTMASLRCALAGDATSWSEEYRFRRSDDSYATVLDRGYLVRDGQGLAVRLIGSMTDLTDRKRLEAQLRQSQKLEAVGRLAGGVAHDFNNLLQVIQSYGGFVAAELPPDAVARADIDEVLKAASRAQALTGQLLAFGRKQVLQPRLLDVNDTVTDVAGMLRRVIGEDIALSTDLCATLWPVHADPGQLTQVLMNLVVNARDAMPEGGTLRVSTAAVTLGRSDARARSGLEPGQYVAVAVEDTGVGIDPAVLPQIFEPFFTTKGPGRGTGLGLATAHGIIEQSGGSITVDSTPGSGSRFTVLLPRAYGPIDAERTLPPPNPLPRGNETILLVEDEPAVRTVVQRMLERQGYVVLAAGDGAEALQVAERARDGIALVLTDVVMPGQRAPALTQQLVARWPAMRVLYMSGYADDEILRRGLTQSGAAFLEKPFTPESLAAAVRRVLDGAAPPRTT